VVHRPQTQALDCPCHKGSFSAVDGRPLAGPPARPLPRILLDSRDGDLVATGIDV
jgi:Rieske Fe-S protein